jgi:single-strand DNA-binding protein
MINVAVLMGRLTADPELKHTNSDVAVTSFTLAVDRGYVKSSSERQTDFIGIVCWRGTAEFASRYFRKGMMVAVEGAIQARTYEDKNGNKRKAVEVVAHTVHFAEPKRKDREQEIEPPAPPVAPYSQGDTGNFVEIDGDDDLPF